MKKLLFIFALPLLFSCNTGNKETNPVEDSLNAVTQGLQGAVHQKDSTLTEFVRAFNEIQDNLDIIKEKEKILTVSSKDPEMQKSEKDQILDDLDAMYQLMEKNKQKIASLTGKLKKANVRIDELEKMVAHLTNQVLEKDIEIAALKEELSSLNVALKELFHSYNERVSESDAKTEQLNTAFYAFGTYKELKEHGILTREGGFIGMGRAEKLKDNFNKSYFTKTDITEMRSITLASKKARLITTHPSGSYELKGTNGKVEALVIKDPTEFWSISKYLVVVVE